MYMNVLLSNVTFTNAQESFALSPKRKRKTPDKHHFLPKNDMILPCPGFPAAFLPFEIDGVVDTGAVMVLSLGAGSSSENDSHPGSSFVTALHVRFDYTFLPPPPPHHFSREP